MNIYTYEERDIISTPRERARKPERKIAMVISRIEMCIKLLKLVIEFVVVFIEAVGTVIRQSTMEFPTNPRYIVPAPYIGLLP